MNQNLREDSNIIFIAGALKNVMENKMEVLLWQNDGVKRLITKGYIFDLSFSSHTLSLCPASEKDFFFKASDVIYFQTNFKHLLFKTQINFTNKNILMLKIPKVVKAVESRAEQRYNLLDSKLSTEMTFLKYRAFKSNPIEHTQHLCEISNGGGSFLITTGALPKFQIGDELSINRIGQDTFKDFKSAKIMSVTHFRNQTFQGFGQHRVGFKFEKKIEAMELSSVKRLFFHPQPTNSA